MSYLPWVRMVNPTQSLSVWSWELTVAGRRKNSVDYEFSCDVLYFMQVSILGFILFLKKVDLIILYSIIKLVVNARAK